MELTGKLHVIGEIKEVSDKFRKREMVVETAENPMYPQFISLQLIQDKCELLDSYQVGQIVKVGFNLKGREWTSPQGEIRYFNSLDAWRIELAQGEQQPQYAVDPSAQQKVVVPNQPATIPTEEAQTGAEDLPF